MKIFICGKARFKDSLSLLLSVPTKTYQILLIFLILILIFSSYDSAQQWQLSNGSSGNSIAAIDIYRSHPEIIYAIGESGMLKSTDCGNNWDSLNFLNTDIGALKIDPYNYKIFYASVFGLDLESNDIVISKDGGLTWEHRFTGRISPAPVVEIDPLDHNTVYVGVGPVFIYRTTDQGLSWNPLPVPDNFYLGGLTSLAISNSNDSILYVGYTSGIFKSTDKGSTWISLNLGFQSHSLSLLAVDPNTSNIVYAAIFPTADYSGGIYKSTDGGQSWNEINNGLSDQNKKILSIIINPKNSAQLFIGIDGYGELQNKLCFESTNGGLQWTDFSEGFPDTGSVNCIAIDTLKNIIYCGIWSNPMSEAGVYIRDILTDINSPLPAVPNEFQLLQNFPNPFNPTTTIQYFVHLFSHIKIEIFDAIGQRIKSIVDDDKQPGTYRVRFNASGLPSGIYFYKMTSNYFTVSKKMILLR
jgi:photosystem II stability/assembly factor-like uncharacterized protein